MASDNTYAFSFREADDQEKLKQAMEEWLAVKEEMLVKLKTKVGQLQKEIEHYKERAFRLQKVEGGQCCYPILHRLPKLSGPSSIS